MTTRGSRRATLWAGVTASSGLLVAHHVPEVRAELGILQTHVAWALAAAVFIWIVYLTLEPFVRARWPHRIISWKRLLSGELRDPLVGRAGASYFAA